MVRFAIAALAAALALASPGAALAKTVKSGVVSGVYEWTETDVGDFEDDSDAYGAEGKFAAPISEGLAYQLDVSWWNVEGAGDDEDVFSGSAHLFNREGDIDGGYLIGAVVGVSSVDGETGYGVGLEAARYWKMFTLSGRLSYLTNDDDDVEVDLVTLEGDGKYFFADNLSAFAGAAIGQVDTEISGFGSSEEDFYQIRGGAEFKFDTLPVSVGGRLAWTDFDEAESTSIRVFLTWNFHDQSLRGRNRVGPDLDPLGGLPVSSSSDYDYEIPEFDGEFDGDYET